MPGTEARPVHSAGIALRAARQVYRNAQRLRSVRARDDGLHCLRHPAMKAEAEYCVHDQVGLIDRLSGRARQHDVDPLVHLVVRLLRERRRRRSLHQHDRHLRPGLREQAGDYKAVAAVVALAAENHCTFAAHLDLLPNIRRDRRAGVFHQRFHRNAGFHRAFLQPADFRRLQNHHEPHSPCLYFIPLAYTNSWEISIENPRAPPWDTRTLSRDRAQRAAACIFMPCREPPGFHITAAQPPPFCAIFPCGTGRRRSPSLQTSRSARRTRPSRCRSAARTEPPPRRGCTGLRGLQP